MAETKKLIGVLREAISDYAHHATEQAPAEWLQNYLSENMPGKTAETIRTISTEITETLALMEEKKAALEAASAEGIDAETWARDEIMSEEEGYGEKARSAAVFYNGLETAGCSLEENAEPELVDVDGDPARWQDGEWNEYSVKDTVKNVAVKAGMTGLREIASDVMVKASEEGIAETLTDGEFIKDTLVSGACTGLKTAVSAGLTIAEDRGFIGHTTTHVLATVAFKTVESLKSIRQVIRGENTFTEMLIDAKNTAVAAFTGMWKRHKKEILEDTVDTVGRVFGAPAAIVAGAVNGMFAEPETEGESRVVTVLKEAGKAAVRWLGNAAKAVTGIFSIFKRKQPQIAEPNEFE